MQQLSHQKNGRTPSFFYLSYITKGGPASDEERHREHPRWDDLCTKHGRPEDVAKPRHDKLRNQLIELNVYQCVMPISSGSRVGTLSFETSSATPLRVLPTMPVRTFRLKIIKCLKKPQQKSDLLVPKLWLKMRDGAFVTMDHELDEQDLGWWGLENGSDVYVYFDAKS